METYEYKAMAQAEKGHWWFVARREFVRQVLYKLNITKNSKQSIADIGAGTGGMMRFLSRFGKTIGVEPNKDGRAHAKKRHIVLKPGFAHNTGLSKNSFDIVCFFDVLYHQGIDEAASLREAKRLLKKGGTLLITDCALPFLVSPHDVHVMGRTRYTKGTLSAAVLREKFRIQYVSYTFFLVFPIVAFWRFLQAASWKMTKKLAKGSDVRPLPRWLNSLLIFICKLETPGYGSISYPWGSSLVLVATK